jgi:hypothetical protein
MYNKKDNIAIEFLLLSYFNLPKEEERDEIIKACTKCAYSDATKQGAYNTRKTREVEYNPELITDCIKNLSENSN